MYLLLLFFSQLIRHHFCRSSLPVSFFVILKLVTAKSGVEKLIMEIMISLKPHQIMEFKKLPALNVQIKYIFIKQSFTSVFKLYFRLQRKWSRPFQMFLPWPSIHQRRKWQRRGKKWLFRFWKRQVCSYFIFEEAEKQEIKYKVVQNRKRLISEEANL